MKVLSLRCTQSHDFEGWFGSEDEFVDQNGRGLIECPLCGDKAIARIPAAPRLNLSGARDTPPKTENALDMRQLWLSAVRHVMRNTEDVGDRFAEEARRIHYGETESRGIRGQATRDDAQALHDEGIEFATLPMPVKETLQ